MAKGRAQRRVMDEEFDEDEDFELEEDDEDRPSRGVWAVSTIT